MKTKIIIAAIGGLVVGAAGGFVGGMYYSDRKNAEEKTREINEVKQSYAQKYASDLKSEANRIAKEIIFRAQESVGTAQPENSAEEAESASSETESDSESESSDEPESSKPGEKPPWIIDPAPQIRHNNVFDNPENPIAPVDYNSFSKGTKFTGQEQLNGNLLRQENAASKSFGASKRAQKEALDNAEAEEDLLDWYDQSRADQEADAEINSQVREDVLAQTPRGLKPGVYLISEQDYEVGNPGYQKSFVVFYDGDGVWTDEDYNRIEDPYQIVGCPDDLVFRGPGHDDEPDRVFVRNQNIMTDYECVKYHRAYGEIAVMEVK